MCILNFQQTYGDNFIQIISKRQTQGRAQKQGPAESDTVFPEKNQHDKRQNNRQKKAQRQKQKKIRPADQKPQKQPQLRVVPFKKTRLVFFKQLQKSVKQSRDKDCGHKAKPESAQGVIKKISARRLGQKTQFTENTRGTLVKRRAQKNFTQLGSWPELKLKPGFECGEAKIKQDCRYD